MVDPSVAVAADRRKVRKPATGSLSMDFTANTLFTDDAALTYTIQSQDGTAVAAWLIFGAGNLAPINLIGHEGIYPLVVSAFDGYSRSSVAFILNVNSIPAFVPFTPPNAIIGVPYEFTVPHGFFTDADGDALTYTATQGGAKWATFDVISGTVTGTPPASLLTTFLTFKANDGLEDSLDYQINFPVTANGVPVVNSAIPDVVL
jgi:hypothetical protein